MTTGPEEQRWRRWPFVLGGTVVGLAVLVAVWDWDWFRPLVAHEASAALGRKVTMQHFVLRLGRQAVAVVEGMQIANPDGFVQDPPLASAERLTVTIDLMELLRHRSVIVPDILIEKPLIVAAQAEDGSANYLFPPSRLPEIVRVQSSGASVSPAGRYMWSWRGSVPTST